MKSILLTTTALVAFAGAAAADGHTGVSFSGSATLGYNDDAAGDHDGYYADMNLDVSMSAALDNGITVTASADVDELDATDGLEWDGVTLSIASESANLTFGDTDSSADLHWSGVDGASVADFNDRDVHIADDSAFDPDAAFDAMIRAEATFGSVTGSLSYGVAMNGGDSLAATTAGADELDAMQLAAVAALGDFTVIGAYQADIELTAGADETQMGVSVAGTVAGFDVMGSYLSAEAGGETSLGLSASMPVGALTVGGYYSMNSNDAETALDAYGLDVSYSDGPFSVSADFDMVEDADEGTWEVDANYDTGLGGIVHVGMNSDEDYYVAGTYDLGGGASLLVSHAVDDNNSSGDEVGEDDLQIGTTVAVSFSF